MSLLEIFKGNIPVILKNTIFNNDNTNLFAYCLLCARHCCKYFVCISVFNPPNSPESLCIMYTWRNRGRDVQRLAQDHTASKWRGQDSNPGIHPGELLIVIIVNTDYDNNNVGS